jgi:hypothetical protein
MGFQQFQALLKLNVCLFPYLVGTGEAHVNYKRTFYCIYSTKHLAKGDWV